MANSVYYGACITAGATDRKVVVLQLTAAEKATIADTYKNGDFLINTNMFFKNGDVLIVHFTQKNTSTNPHLIISIGDANAETTELQGQGRKVVYKSNISPGSGSWDDGETITFTYLIDAQDDSVAYWSINDGGKATQDVYGVVKLETNGQTDTSGAITLNKAKSLVESANGGSLSYIDNYPGTSGVHIGTLTLTTLIDGETNIKDIELHSPSLNGLATTDWITNKNYTTLGAVQNWVNAQGYITANDIPDGVSPYTGTMSAVGTTASAGTVASYARGNHVHNITGTTIGAALGYTPVSNTHTHVIKITPNSNPYSSTTDAVEQLQYGATYYLTLRNPAQNGGYSFYKFKMPAAIEPGRVDLSPYLTKTEAADTYAVKNHTHAIELRVPSTQEVQQMSQGTIVPVNLSASRYYVLTAGGSKVFFRTPTDANDIFIVEEIQSKNLLFKENAYCPYQVSAYPSNVKDTYINTSTEVVYISCTKSGYTPVGVVGWNMEMGEVSSTSSYKDFKNPEQISLWTCSITTFNTDGSTNAVITNGKTPATLSAGSYIICQMTNIKNVKATANIKVKVLYKKN